MLVTDSAIGPLIPAPPRPDDYTTTGFAVTVPPAIIDRWRAMARSTTGLSTKNASAAASRSHPAATHSTGSHEPAISTRSAAPQPAKIDAAPLAVYWIP